MTSAVIEIGTLADLPLLRIVSIKGDVDELSLHELVASMQNFSTDGTTVTSIIVDLSNVTFMNSKGLSQLIVLHTTMTAQQKKLILAGANEFVTDLISMVGVMKMIPYYVTVEEAVSSVRS